MARWYCMRHSRKIQHNLSSFLSRTRNISASSIRTENVCTPCCLLSVKEMKFISSFCNRKSIHTLSRTQRQNSYGHSLTPIVRLTPTSQNAATLRLHSTESSEQQYKPPKSSYSTVVYSSADESNPRPVFLPLDTSFSNANEAYKSKTTPELWRALFVFKLTSYELLVTNNMMIMKAMRRLLGKRLFQFVMQKTFYGQFVAGADVNEIKPVIKKNLAYGVKSILDYSVEEDIPEDEAKEKRNSRFTYHDEFGDRRRDVTSARTYFYDSEGQCDKNMWTFMKCIDVVAEATEGTGLAAVKLTALGRPQFLLQMSKVLTLMKERFDDLTSEETDIILKRVREDTLDRKLSYLGIPFSRDETKEWFTWLDVSGSGEIDLYSWSNLLNTDRSLQHIFTVPNLETGKLETIFPLLTKNEETEMKNMLRRVNTLVEHAEERGVRVMVDAEQTYFQPAISRLTMEMMRKFNKDQAVIFNTYQCYLKKAYENFIIDLDLSQREGFSFGAKVVRGAYMDQERERARTVGYEDPINESFEATTAMYQRVIDKTMRESKKRDIGRIAVMAATHNEDSVRFCVQKLKEYGIRREDRVICFGQLLGMCDHISFPLGQSGYSVYKYVPYGPVDEVLPYLSRRAVENRGILAKVQKERHLLWSEIKTRSLPKFLQ